METESGHEEMKADGVHRLNPVKWSHGATILPTEKRPWPLISPPGARGDNSDQRDNSCVYVDSTSRGTIPDYAPWCRRETPEVVRCWINQIAHTTMNIQNLRTLLNRTHLSLEGSIKVQTLTKRSLLVVVRFTTNWLRPQSSLSLQKSEDIYCIKVEITDSTYHPLIALLYGSYVTALDSRIM